MALLKLLGIAYTFLGTTASVIGGIDAIKRLSNKTASDLFKESFIDAVDQSAHNFVDLTGSERIGVDENVLDEVIASLEETELVPLDESEPLPKIIAIFQKCIILPGHQLTTRDLESRLRPVIKNAFVIFFERLPRNEQASDEIMLEFQRTQLSNQESLIRDNASIKEDTSVIKETTQTTHSVVSGLDAKVSDLLSRHLNINISAAVEAAIETEHQSAIANANDLLKKYKPQSAFDSLKNLKKRVWTNASQAVKFSILTNMAAAQLALNKEEEAGMLLLKAFQYNPEDEISISNRASAHFFLKEIEKAEEYAKKAIDRNPSSTQGYALLVEISTDDETLDEVIAKVPEYLRKTPQIAHAISDAAKQRLNLDEAMKWREIAAGHEQEDDPDFNASLAAILIEQVVDDSFALFTNQFNDSQKGQLRRAVDLLTEAWDCVANTELRNDRISWIINRSTAQRLLGKPEEVIKDLNTVLEIDQTDPIVLKNRAILAFEQGEKESAIDFLEKIQSAPETPEAPIVLAGILFVYEKHDDAIMILKDFLTTDPPLKLREEANRLLVQIYIADKRLEEVGQISSSIHESHPTSVLNLVNAARISYALEKNDEALSYLKEACNLVPDSKVFQEIFELATELYRHGQFEEAGRVYEKLADKNQNSLWTQFLLYSYYQSGEVAKALEICQNLREKHGVLENISKIEYGIYEEMGDLNQARVLGEAYLRAFPDDTDTQIELADVYYRLDNIEKFNSLLEKSYDLKNLSLQSCFNLAHLYRIGSRPEEALDIMYEVRRMRYDNPDAHLNYIGFSYQVENQIGESLRPNQVQPGTAVRVNRSDQQATWYIIEESADADITRNERNVNDPLVQKLLGKTVNEEICVRKTPLGPEIGTITAIVSKYIGARQISFDNFSTLFPEAPGLFSVNLNNPTDSSENNSHETDDSPEFQPIYDIIDRQYEVSLRVEDVYKELLPPIGVFANLMKRNVLAAWESLMITPDLGVRCSIGDYEERQQALALLSDGQPKLVMDIISLMTIHSLEVADTIVRAFGKLSIAQSTIDALLNIINEQKGMWTDQKAVSPWKQGDQYIIDIIEPENVRENIERLEGIIKWIRENCEIQPCSAALQMNMLHKRKLDDVFQRFFIDTMLIANQPGYLLFSDDERLRFYAKTNFSSDAGMAFYIHGVWTQVILQHCVNNDFLDKTEYSQLAIKLVCSNYHHTEFDADVLMEAARQSDWRPVEPYNSLVRVLGDQRANLPSVLDVAADFLFTLWTHPILFAQPKFLTLCLLDGLTSGRRTRIVLEQLANRIKGKSPLYSLAEERILEVIREYSLIYPVYN